MVRKKERRGRPPSIFTLYNDAKRFMIKVYALDNPSEITMPAAKAMSHAFDTIKLLMENFDREALQKYEKREVDLLSGIPELANYDDINDRDNETADKRDSTENPPD